MVGSSHATPCLPRGTHACEAIHSLETLEPWGKCRFVGPGSIAFGVAMIAPGNVVSPREKAFGEQDVETILGVIGGSGVYAIDGLDEAEWRDIETPWGKPSDSILCGRLSGLRMAFLPRHGRGHVHSPTSVPIEPTSTL